LWLHPTHHVLYREDELKDVVDEQKDDTKGDTVEPEKAVCLVCGYSIEVIVIFLQPYAPAGKKGKKPKKGFADIDWYIL